MPFVIVDDPLVLTHPSVRKDKNSDDTSIRLALAEWWNQFPFLHSFLFGGASSPSPMAGVNAKVVHESAVALKYGPNFVYYERYVPHGFRASMLLNASSIIVVLLLQIVLLLFMVLVKLPGIGSWVANQLLAPSTRRGALLDVNGTGSSEEFVEIYAEVQSSNGSSGGRPKGNLVKKANCYMKFQGDADYPSGDYGVTAQCVCEAAFCLLWDREHLPPKSNDGFGSPAEIFGACLVKRLTTNKVRPVQCTTSHVRMAAPKNEWRMFHHNDHS